MGLELGQKWVESGLELDEKWTTTGLELCQSLLVLNQSGLELD